MKNIPQFFGILLYCNENKSPHEVGAQSRARPSFVLHKELFDNMR